MFVNESKILTSLAFENNVSYIIALDEVGRGAGAGPVVVCASLWEISQKIKPAQPKWLPLVADSKQLTIEQREECFSSICKHYNISINNFSIYFNEIGTNSCADHSKLSKSHKIFKLSQKELKKIKIQEKKHFECLCFCLGVATNLEIDKVNIWNAIQIAANRALFKIKDRMKEFELLKIFENSILVLDGHMPVKVLSEFELIPQVTVIGGDALLKTIGFSSILAKVSRDKYMINLREEFPNFEFELHKGYLTKKHQINLKKFGQTRIHRQSFLKNLCQMDPG